MPLPVACMYLLHITPLFHAWGIYFKHALPAFWRRGRLLYWKKVGNTQRRLGEVRFCAACILILI